ncbi:MAG: LysR family transcriptional regulator [Alphaproteobacteria bacterium]
MDLKRNINIISKLLIFQEIAENGQIKNTAFTNGYKQSNLSKAIKELEEELGTILFNRKQNGVSLTKDGQKAFEIACEVSNTIKKINTFKNSSDNTQGDVRLWAGDGIVSGYIINYLSDFFEEYPQISLDITCSITPPQLIHETDIAVVYEKPTQKDVEIILEKEMIFSLFASKKYLAQYGYPKNIEDLLENHRICNKVIFSSVWKDWKKLLEKAKNVCIQTRASSTLIDATKAGLGVSLHPITINNKEKDFIHLSKLDIKYTHPFWIITHKNIKDTPKIKALLNVIKKI